MQIEANKIYLDIKIAHKTGLRNQIKVNGFSSSNERTQHQVPFELSKHATLDGAQWSSEEKTDNV